MYTELVKDHRTLEVIWVLAIGAELEGLVEQLRRAVKHLADNGQPLNRVGLEDGKWRQGFADQRELPAEVELCGLVVWSVPDEGRSCVDVQHLELQSSGPSMVSGLGFNNETDFAYLSSGRTVNMGSIFVDPGLDSDMMRSRWMCSHLPQRRLCPLRTC